MCFPGQKCPLCDQPIASGPIFSTWGVWLDLDDPLFRFCDASMHQSCYAEWPHRERFADGYFRFWVEAEEQDLFWHRAFLDENVLVAVNPQEPVNAAWVHLRATGSRISVKTTQWAEWLASLPAESDHPVFAEAMRRAKATLRESVPDEAALLANIDWPRKRPIVEAYVEAQRQRRRQRGEGQRQVHRYNKACERLMLKIATEGLACPHCGVRSNDYRVSTANGKRSAVICKACAHVVEPWP